MLENFADLNITLRSNKDAVGLALKSLEMGPGDEPWREVVTLQEVSEKALARGANNNDIVVGLNFTPMFGSLAESELRAILEQHQKPVVSLLCRRPR